MSSFIPQLRGLVSWDGKKLVADNQAVIDKLRRKTLSASTAQSMDGCIARWAGERLMKTAEDPFGAAPQGTAGHEIMEDLFAMLPQVRTKEAAEKLLQAKADKQWPVLPGAPEDVAAAVLENRRRWVEEVRHAYIGLFDIEDPREVKVLSLEFQVQDIEVAGVPAIGYVDRISEVTTADGVTGMSIDDYKGLAVDTPIPTPTGWTTMGELAVGDVVLGADGKPANVIAKSGTHHRNCYEVVFSDGSTVVCDNVHLWQVIDTAKLGRKAAVSETVDADELYERVSARGKGRISIHVPNTAPLELPEAELPIDPWLLGAWLGDGTAKSGELTIGASDRDAMLGLLGDCWADIRTSENAAGTVTAILAGNQARNSQVVTEADAALCGWSHKLDEGACQTCTAAVSEARRTAIAAVPLTNLKPKPDACPYGHDYPGGQLSGGNCKPCARVVARGARRDTREGRWNVRPNMTQCPRGHELRGKTGENGQCVDCVLIGSKAGREALAAFGPKTNVRTVETVRDYFTEGNSFASLLRGTGLRGAKAIPAAYLRGSVAQRTALLQGLMDTDGSFNTGRGRAVFVNTSKNLADGVFELVSSLGVTAQRFEKGYKNAVRPDATVYMIEFRPLDIMPFRLERKAAAVRAMQSEYKRTRTTIDRSLRRDIVGMNVVESVPTECIAVDADDQLYLCGLSMIPTHNTGKKIPNPRFGDHYGDQLRIYTDAVRTLTGEKPVAAKLLYTKVGEARPVNISDRAIDKTLKHFAAAWDKHNKYMDAGAFPTETGPLCGWCPLVNGCHVAKAAGLGPRVDGLPSATDLGIPSLRPGIAPVPVTSTEDMTVSGSKDVTFWAPEPDWHGLVELGRDYDRSAHMNSSGENPDKLEGQEPEMPRIVEEKPWEVYSGGELNPASYAAVAAFGLTSMAVENLHKAGLPVNGKNVKALASTYLHVVTEAQKSWTGSVAMADSANTRLRGALHTVLTTLPQPFGQDTAAWSAWVDAAIRRCQAITSVALFLFGEPKADQPWASLEGAPAAVETAEPKAPVLAAVPDIEPAPAKARAAAKAPADPDFPDEDDLDDSALSEFAS